MVESQLETLKFSGYGEYFEHLAESFEVRLQLHKLGIVLVDEEKLQPPEADNFAVE